MSTVPRKCPKCGAPKVPAEDESIGEYACGSAYAPSADYTFESTACLRAQLSACTDQLRRMKDIIWRAIPLAEHGATQVEPGHSCSDPNAQCDVTCMNAAYDAELLLEMRKAVRESDQ